MHQNELEWKLHSETIEFSNEIENYASNCYFWNKKVCK